jgi:hypothetical protein
VTTIHSSLIFVTSATEQISCQTPSFLLDDEHFVSATEELTMAPNCPDRRRLSEFASGKLADPLAEEVAGHLEQCSDCQSTIVNLAEDQDTMASALQKIAANPPQPVEPPVQ